MSAVARDPEIDVRALEAFLVREADLLDSFELEAWLELFAPDGRYWVPASWDQVSPLDQVSLYYEDPDLLKTRIMRLRHRGTENMRPAPRTLRTVSNVRLAPAPAAAGEVEALSSLLMVDYRLNEQRLFAGHCRHRLRRIGGELKIVLKRVDILNCDMDAGFVRLTMPF